MKSIRLNFFYENSWIQARDVETSKVDRSCTPSCSGEEGLVSLRERWEWRVGGKDGGGLGELGFEGFFTSEATKG